jgi:outer membrane protein assembly factor BamB
MAYGQRPHRRSNALIVTVLAAVWVAFPFFLGSEALARQRPKTHFLSWESLRRPEEFRRLDKRVRPLRRFNLSRRRVVKLKKSSFWNRRPYQFSTPLVYEGRIYLGVDAGFFYAVDMSPPSKRWTFRAEGPIQAQASAADDAVYFGDCKGFVYALERASGDLLWKVKLDAEIMAKPLVAGNRLYVVTMSGRLFALDRQRGVEIWHTDASERGFGFAVRRCADPVLKNGLIYVGTSAGTLFAYRASDGQIVWVRQLGDRRSMVYDLDSTPLFAHNCLYVTSSDQRLSCLGPTEGRVVWSIDVGGANDLLFHKDRLYVSDGGSLYAVEPATGQLLWQQDLETPGLSAPAAGKDFIAIVSTSDKLYLIDDDTGDIVYERYIRKGSFGDPVVVGDQVFVLSNSSRLFSFRVRELPPRKVRGEK